MLCLYVQAPFGAFRTFTAGSFRPTAGFITPSATYGLLLNVAGIEMREYSDAEPMTLIKTGLPRFRLAIGALSPPAQHTVYQQLHNYPVGSSGKERADETKGNKYNIVPVRRAFLSDIRAYLCVDAEPSFEDDVCEGLAGRRPRMYGLPFLGDNNFLVDRINAVESRQPARWYVPIRADTGEGLREDVTRLTIAIDRADMARTGSALFAPIREAAIQVPEEAWVEVGY